MPRIHSGKATLLLAGDPNLSHDRPRSELIEEASTEISASAGGSSSS